VSGRDGEERWIARKGLDLATGGDLQGIEPSIALYLQHRWAVGRCPSPGQERFPASVVPRDLSYIEFAATCLSDLEMKLLGMSHHDDGSR